MKAIAIVGAGIAGLTAAYELELARRAGAEFRYTIFESGGRIGGALQTAKRNGFVIELGADSFLSEKPWAFELCRELGIEDQLIGSNDLQRQTWVLSDGKLHPLPAGLQFIVPTSLESLRSELFSDVTRNQFLREKEMVPRESTSDESVASFVERHFGGEFLERIAGPMLAGIYGGDCSRLSARAVMPKLVNMEGAHGSLQGVPASIEKSAAPKTSVFTSLNTGMESIATKIAEKLHPGAIQLKSAVASLRRDGKRWKVTQAGDKLFDAVIIAAPAFAAAELLKEQSPALAGALTAIRYTSSSTVALSYDAQSAKLPGGFGVLVPRSEKRQMMACTFVHNKFPGRVPGGKALIRLFFGGADNEGVIHLSDKQLIALARREIDEIFAVKSKPQFAMVARWPRSMPQYEVGHLERVAEIDQLATNLPNLALCGSAYEGVGVPDCIRGGREAARRMIASLQL